ncbi:nuclear transport factor 2 family protein [Dermatobacter hominis]|uniref:nuclear transport factor 2 family protein n=1 Tax=Dermatobacter hominis TaxID=2884263 RepID=UPI001D1246D5|nr:nuclear transport factor 2 family protein [Dermatobacter hominis]UDY35781.1 nuclear transport factor 2 family protein [Dermatobacter hominis]
MSSAPSADPGPDDLARLVAHDQIRMLANRYAVAVDSRDLDALVELFVDDVQVGRDTFGRDALRASFQASLSAVGVSMLHVGTHQIDLLGPDDATGLVYCLGQVADGDRWVHQSILYRDTYARRDGRWRFVRRLHELWYGEAAPTNPLDQAPANWPERPDGRGTVPESFPSWERFWLSGSGGDGGAPAAP